MKMLSKALVLLISTLAVCVSSKDIFAATPASGLPYYVDQWCATSGVLDDTCFSNAISDLSANGPVGYQGRRMGVLLVPTGVYNFKRTVTIPRGINISIVGLAQDSVWGAVIQPLNSSPVPTYPLFAIEADSVDLQHLTFLGQSFSQDAIILGTAKLATFDTHINWCWFNGLNRAIHAVNYSGGDFSHNTFDVVGYGIYSDYQAAGDVMAQSIVATDLRGYASQHSVIHIAGTPQIGAYPDNFGHNTFSGAFDHAVTPGEAAVFLWGVVNNRVSGTFDHNSGDDIYIYGSQSVNVGPINTFSTGNAVVRVDTSNNVMISNVTSYNANTGNAPGTTAVISVTGSHQTTISNVSAMNAGATTVPAYGLYVDSPSSGTVLSGNSFTGQRSAAYNVNDVTATMALFGPVNPN